MKKLLIGALLIGSISSFARTIELESCKVEGLNIGTSFNTSTQGLRQIRDVAILKLREKGYEINNDVQRNIISGNIHEHKRGLQINLGPSYMQKRDLSLEQISGFDLGGRVRNSLRKVKHNLTKNLWKGDNLSNITYVGTGEIETLYHSESNILAKKSNMTMERDMKYVEKGLNKLPDCIQK